MNILKCFLPNGKMHFFVLSMLLIYASYLLKHFHVVVSSDGWHSYIHTFESNADMFSRVIFYLKSVNFLFLFSLVNEDN